MYSNRDSIEMFNQMVAMGHYYASGRPVAVDPAIIVEDVCSKLPMTKTDVVLDVGCGTGVVTIPLARRCRFIHALDAGEKVIETARAHCRQEAVQNIAYDVGGALYLPFGDDFFDYVLMYAVIHYLKDEKQVRQCVGELVRVCKPGGRVLIAEIPDQRVRQEFEQKPKTPEELKILEDFKANRNEYDRLFKEYVQKNSSQTGLVLDCQQMIEEGRRLGCEGRVCRQDIRQPFSLTRRDVLLIKSKGPSS